jgi:hypothetical protein
METILIKNYTFDKAAKTITLTDVSTVELERLVSITDVTNGVVIYLYKNPSYNATVAGNVITLVDFDTNNDNFANTDKLAIEYVGDGVTQTLVPSALRSATFTTNEIQALGKGATFIINSTAIDGTPDLIVSVEAKDPVSGLWVEVRGAKTGSIISVATTYLSIYPGQGETPNIRCGTVLPEKYRLNCIFASTTSITYSVGVIYHK